MSALTKICSRCKYELPIEVFTINRTNKDGVGSRCRPCHAIASKESREANPGVNTAATKRWKQQHPEAARAIRQRNYRKFQSDRLSYSKAYRVANPEKRRKLHKQWRDRHPEVNRAKVKKWVRQHPGRANALKAAHRAKCKSPPTDVKEFYVFIKTAARLRCRWCNKVVPKKKRHVDHIIAIARGGPHVRSNLCCACADCNHRKHAKTVEEFANQRELAI